MAYKIAILGGGPMGLSTAYHCLKSSVEVHVFEADSCAGGMSASFDFDGTRIEKYYHFINRPDNDLFSILNELGMGKDLHWTETKMGIFRPAKGQKEGRLLPFGNPLALLSFSDAPLVTRLRYGVHALICKYRKDILEWDDISAYEWIKQWEGESGYTYFWKALFEKKFFELSDPLSAAWIASRIRRVANSRKSLMVEELGYLKGGSESLIQKLLSSIEQKQGKVHLNSLVTKVVPQGAGYMVYTQDNEAEYFDKVISTIPLPYVKDVFEFLPKAYTDTLQKIPNIGVACALFKFAKPITHNFWLNIDMPSWDIPGIIEYSNLRPMDAAHVYVPFYMPNTHSNWEADDSGLLSKARSYISAINPEAARTEQASAIFRYEYAQPVCRPGFRHILPDYNPGVDNVYIADTTHSFPEDRSIQESVRIGKELAEKVVQEV